MVLENEIIDYSMNIQFFISPIDTVLYTRCGNMAEDPSFFSLEDQRERTRVLSGCSRCDQSLVAKIPRNTATMWLIL